MPGFIYRYRRHGGRPTLRSVVPAQALVLGDMLSTEEGDGNVALADDASVRLLGAVIETGNGVTTVQVVTDLDAIYGVGDPHARTKGDALVLTGASGTQGVTPAGRTPQLLVEADCGIAEETLVAILGVAQRDLLAAETAARRTGGDLNAALARLVTRLYRQHTGRGPTRIQAFYRGDVVVVLLENTMTKAERTLVDRGRRDAVLLMREALQEAMRAELMSAVAMLTGAEVRALLSANHVDPDLAVETFVLDRPVQG
jgi:uncharacterized protein YbcI